MAWMKVGEDLPVKDDNGNRPVFDDDKAPRETEFVDFEPLAAFEFNMNDMARTIDRRWLKTVLDSVTRTRILSSHTATDYEDVYQQVCRKYITGVRLIETGKELDGAELQEFLQDQDWDAAFAIMTTIRVKSELAERKKKSLNSWFGSHTQ